MPSPGNPWNDMFSCHFYYPLVICYIAIENGHLWWIYPLTMVIFHSFVKVYQRVMCGNMWKLNKENAGKKSGLVLLASWIEHQGKHPMWRHSIQLLHLPKITFTSSTATSPHGTREQKHRRGGKNTSCEWEDVHVKHPMCRGWKFQTAWVCMEIWHTPILWQFSMVNLRFEWICMVLYQILMDKWYWFPLNRSCWLYKHSGRGPISQLMEVKFP